MRLLFCGAVLSLGALLLSLPAHAADLYPLQVSWQWPIEYCDGSPLAVEDIEAAEIYLDTEAIPAASEAAGDSCHAPTDVPPASPIVETITTAETTVTIPVERGKTWHGRMRVQVNGVWSNLSAELKADIPFAQPDVPIIIRFN